MPDASAQTDAGLASDAETSDGGVSLADAGPPPTVDECFGDIVGALGPDYSPYDPVMGHHCLGTNHQTIEGVQRVVFLGDSVTKGTPPTRREEYYRNVLGERLTALWGDDLVIDDCSDLGARTDDFLLGKKQIERCFPEGGDERTTLVVFTMGGNDIFEWAQADLDLDDALVEADKAAELLDDAITWLTTPRRFPNGSFVIFANPYEYTDATGDLASCDIARRVGITENWLRGAPSVVYFQSRYMEIATRHQVDLIFTLEHFCGHGFHNENPESQCYRGPNTPRWFDFTCIHPTPEGHGVIADMFEAVVIDRR